MSPRCYGSIFCKTWVEQGITIVCRGKFRGDASVGQSQYRSNLLINHLSITVSDIEASKAFYEVVLASLGYAVAFEGIGSVSFGAKEGDTENADQIGRASCRERV